MPRPKLEFRTASRENYKLFCKSNKDVKISFEEYKKILYTYNELIIKHILDTGDKIKLPFGLGCITINKYKKKKRKINKTTGEEIIALSVDYKRSKEEGVRVYHLNYHTDGYNYYWAWLYKDARIKCSFIWKFEIARIPSRLLASYLKTPSSIYKDIYKEWVKRKY